MQVSESWASKAHNNHLLFCVVYWGFSSWKPSYKVSGFLSRTDTPSQDQPARSKHEQLIKTQRLKRSGKKPPDMMIQSGHPCL